MKTILASRSRNLLLLAVIAPFCFGGLNAKANLLTTFPQMADLLTNFAAFSLGGGINSTDTFADQFSGNTDIFGNVGIAGDGNLTMSGGATIHGDLYYYSTGTLKKNGNAMVVGATYHDTTTGGPVDTRLNAGINAAMITATNAFALGPTPTGSINLSDHQNMTIMATGPVTVLSLQNFSLSGGSTLTLQGTATQNFVLNVSSQFSLTGSSKIVLSGGVAWDCVLFNVRNNGSDVTVSGQSILNGVLMANNRTASLSGGSTVNGEVIANKITLSGSSVIVHPPLSSP